MISNDSFPSKKHTVLAMDVYPFQMPTLDPQKLSKAIERHGAIFRLMTQKILPTNIHPSLTIPEKHKENKEP